MAFMTIVDNKIGFGAFFIMVASGAADNAPTKKPMKKKYTIT
jgi:hypothetical protein